MVEYITWRRRAGGFFISGIFLYLAIVILEKPSIKKSPTAKRQKSILMWTNFFGKIITPTHRLWPNFSTFPVSDCSFSVNNKEDPAKFDAIIFHIRDLKLKHLPVKRNYNQRYIFLLKESPVHDHTNYNDNRLDNLFNWTMTYRLDSDIITTSSGFVVARSQQNKVNQTLRHNWLPGSFLYKKSEKRLVAWMASNCKTHSKREHFVKNLQKFLPIHVYGGCGNRKCTKGNPDCKVKLSTYKFYLSFENSLCKDYVTEKLHNWLRAGVVPVVRGGADYTLFAPPRSFINVDDFNSTKELANYLVWLDNNDDEYLKYFEWRELYQIDPAFPRPWCQLCQKLHGETQHKSYSKSSLKLWWKDGGHCYRPK